MIRRAEVLNGCILKLQQFYYQVEAASVSHCYAPCQFR